MLVIKPLCIISPFSYLINKGDTIRSFAYCPSYGQWCAGSKIARKGRQLKWHPTLRDLKIGFVFIFMDDIANFGYSCEQKFSFE